MDPAGTTFPKQEISPMPNSTAADKIGSSCPFLQSETSSYVMQKVASTGFVIFDVSFDRQPSLSWGVRGQIKYIGFHETFAAFLEVYS